MIEVNVEGYCQNCTRFEADVRQYTYYTNEDEWNCTEIKCAHRKQCKNIAKYLTEQVNKKKG